MALRFLGKKKKRELCKCSVYDTSMFISDYFPETREEFSIHSVYRGRGMHYMYHCLIYETEMTA